jgi:hypothetical protein
VTLIEEDSRTAVPKLEHRFDITLIDANHAYEYVLADALNSWPLLATGGFMAFHDYGCVEETTRAVEDFLSQTGARLVGSFWFGRGLQVLAIRSRRGAAR